MGLTRLSFVRAMAFQSTTKFLPGSRWFLGSLEFLTDKFGNLRLQEPKFGKLTGSGTSHLLLAPIQVGLINDAQLRHRLGSSGEMDTDPPEDKADHPMSILTDTTGYGREVYMVEQGGELSEKAIEEIQWEAEEEIARAEHLARELFTQKLDGSRGTK
jgi:hypothetical protein